MKFYLSKNESNRLKCKFYRSTETFSKLPFNEMEALFKTEEVDILRLKLDASNMALFNELNKIPYYYEIFNLNNKYRLSIDNKLKLNENLAVNFIQVNKVEKEYLITLNDILKNKTWLEYESLILNNKLTENKRIDIALGYYSKFSSNNKDEVVVKMFVKDIEVGLFIAKIESNRLFGVLVGIRTKYRGMNYAKYFYNFILDYCNKNGLKYFDVEVNTFNFPSQNFVKSAGFKSTGFFYNVNIFPKFNFKSRA